MPRLDAILLSLCLALTAMAAPVRAESVTVFAASSLADALRRIAAAYEAEGGSDVLLALGASSTLARQITRGAPADVYLAASPDWMDAVEAAGRVVPGTRRDLLCNALVLIGPAGAAPIALTSDQVLARLGDGKLAMALVDAVPAGVYGKSALGRLGLWQALAPQVAQAATVRAALALVATGAAPLGVVYATDALADPRVAALARFPASSHPPIRYPAAVVTAGDTAPAIAFLDYLRGDAAASVFASGGFGLADAPAETPTPPC